ncbi:hypothetical protein M0657_006861 [Pyricularia oryzae]|uniref:Uncharacterized protein n=1 Tax=Pyricularia oryzae TaxID=318829 RepID=A0A4P7ND62_PYROR|nr:hypothetical protein M0657_006861 [Pyricularia oryzae]KAI7928439.1 hypothetical protein M9X92_001825 [Pyricularia oryzae]QBZ58820.1 hypothetical protein PoMZ_03778 [Pyricularia oryzae]
MEIRFITLSSVAGMKSRGPNVRNGKRLRNSLEDCMHHYLHFCWSQMQAPRHLMIQFHRSSVVGPLKVVYHPQLAMLSP